jgi:hypothetical protein
MKLRVVACSWNVGASEPPDAAALRLWLCRGAAAPDLVAVALQEIVHLSELSSYVGSANEGVPVAWARALAAALEGHAPYGGARYRVVANAHMVGIMTCVLARCEGVFERIDAVKIGYFACGTLGVVGNKGGVSVRFRLALSPRKYRSYCFVGAHLTAHQAEVAKRNADFAAIYSKTVFFDVDRELSEHHLSRARVPLEQILGALLHAVPGALHHVSGGGGGGGGGGHLHLPHHHHSRQEPRGSSDGGGGGGGLAKTSHDFGSHRDLLQLAYGQEKALHVADHDCVFWLGDLNYRVDGVDAQEAVRRIQDHDLRPLLAGDQLSVERRQLRTFSGFAEGEIRFPPTYKFAPGSHHYDKGGEDGNANKKARVPSWCDRVLWRVADNDPQSQVQQLSYYCVPALVMSDHRPVGAEFVFPFVDVGGGGSRTALSALSALSAFSSRYAPETHVSGDGSDSGGGDSSRLSTARAARTPPRSPASGGASPASPTSPTSPTSRGAKLSALSIPAGDRVSARRGAPSLSPVSAGRSSGASASATAASPGAARAGAAHASARGAACAVAAPREPRPSATSTGGDPRKPDAKVPTLMTLPAPSPAPGIASAGSATAGADAAEWEGREQAGKAKRASAPREVAGSRLSQPSRSFMHSFVSEYTARAPAALKTAGAAEPGAGDALALALAGGEGRDQGEPDSEPGRSSPPLSEAPSARAQQSCLALVSVKGGAADELSFRAGDLLELFHDERMALADGWLLARRVADSKVGYLKVEAVKPLGAVQANADAKHHRSHALKATALRYDRVGRKRAQREGLGVGASAGTDAGLGGSPRPRSRTPSGSLAAQGSAMLSSVVSTLRHMSMPGRPEPEPSGRARSASEEYFALPRFREMRANANYSAREPDELSFQEGELLAIVSLCPDADNDDGWWVARAQDGSQGLAPRRLFDPVLPNPANDSDPLK